MRLIISTDMMLQQILDEGFVYQHGVAGQTFLVNKDRLPIEYQVIPPKFIRLSVEILDESEIDVDPEG